ncbi:MAG: UvrD-helicase domain-containing protein [Candidatus Pacearchaeota archaeon]
MEKEIDNSTEYLKILKALREIPFQVGKNLLVDFLAGNYKNKSVVKNHLDQLNGFGMMEDKERILPGINNLISAGMIEQVVSDYNKFIKVLRITIKGQNEIVMPTLIKKRMKNNLKFKISEVNEEDKRKFSEFDDFLKGDNDEQKKAIISQAEKILCIAGAGSGKTSVLIKRIEFLVRKKNIDPKKVLAITFTRKAKKEMEKRLRKINIVGINIHTFNSFCEKILRDYENEIYGKKIRVQNYSDKIIALNMAIANLGLNMEDVINNYFTKKQREFKTASQLIGSFMNDCFSVIDYFKVTGKKEYDFSVNVDDENRKNAQIIYQINKFVKEHMNIQGLRDFTDQLIDTIKFFEQNPSFVPKFDYILIDEYQDVNAMQVKLIKLLGAKNLFAVGDPRQAIFGWRGSDIKYILNFEEDYGQSEVIYLTKNYRSSKNIVKFINYSIREFGLPDLNYYKEKETEIKILNFDTEEGEREFVLNNILESSIPNNEVFVLARTNRQLLEISNSMKARGIAHILKTDELKSEEDDFDGVTLATIHAIKGLQAKKVFVIGCNEQNFPCKASDHPAIEMLKSDNYNKEEEEKCLFYVAISRAKEILYLTYSGKKPTYFINEEMMRIGSN